MTSSFSRLIRLPNQSGTLLLLLPTLWALVLASDRSPDPFLIGVFVVGAFLMRSAGVIFNDLADRKIDQRVERTKNRPLASGALSPRQALSLAIALVALAFGLVWLLNPLTISLSPIALLLAAVYPFAKRWIHIPQLVLGIAFGWGVVMAWAAVQNTITATAWLLFLATVCWAIAYDTIYAMQDREDDLQIGVKSSAILFGRYVWIGVATFSILTIIFLLTAGWTVNLGRLFYAGIGLISLILAYQTWKLTKPLETRLYFHMFKQHVWIGVGVLAAIWIGKL